jgi:hypothetical protein
MVQAIVVAAVCCGAVAVGAGAATATTMSAAGMHPMSCSDNGSAAQLAGGGCFGGKPDNL